MVGSVIDEVAGLEAASTKQTTIHDFFPRVTLHDHLQHHNDFLIHMIVFEQCQKR